MWTQEDTIIANRPRPVQSLFFVCKGNICRSPLAEAYVKSKIKGKNQLRVFSAGLDTTPGHTANAVAETIARQYGLALEEHRTTPISREMIRQADLIVVMDYAQRQTLLATYPEAQGKVSLLSSFRSGILTHIPDPYGGTIEQFDHCYHLISQSCDNLLTYIEIPENASAHER
ncbi:MAG: Low molecular weight protein-tyrosine-phosphatase Wzb (modular protein) [Nitrospira sp.]